jgi:hypothetical protein
MSLSPKGKKPDGRDNPIPVVIERRCAPRRLRAAYCPQPVVVLISADCRLPTTLLLLPQPDLQPTSDTRAACHARTGTARITGFHDNAMTILSNSIKRHNSPIKTKLRGSPMYVGAEHSSDSGELSGT